MKKIFLVVLTVFLASNCFAAKPAKEAQADAPKKKVELPKSGSLSTSGTFGHGTNNANSSWGRGEADGAPISGSVSRLSDREWKMVVVNQSKDKYQVDVSVKQYTQNGGTAKSDHFSYTLKPGEKTDRTVSSAFNSARAELSLDHWKKFETAKKKEANEGEASEAQAEEKK